ncbi:MAG: hypothetical protein ACE5J4_02900 [Candidatus Aenigmatarchaeota archaeon]
MSNLVNTLEKYGKEIEYPENVIVIDKKYMGDFSFGEVMRYCSKYDKVIFIASKEDIEREEGVVYQIGEKGAIGVNIGLLERKNLIRAKDALGIPNSLYA